jgi:3-dehydroquinate synthase II
MMKQTSPGNHGTWNDGILLCPHEINQIKKVAELIEKIQSES